MLCTLQLIGLDLDDVLCLIVVLGGCVVGRMFLLHLVIYMSRCECTVWVCVSGVWGDQLVCSTSTGMGLCMRGNTVVQ